ncbi:sigma-70 family RNA polymerase sigma factor [Actinomarinicola tropica]|uniref:Sigma-70 family RNA polymerase sigma factor n=2 Tax=Actinomarinicola tropica TaxID=2789776 RepID=A0A5Q2RSC3_9ACTN|nr:sigma-70 family RNA polymerase sigma factor [Actinomarinicola tropica]
MLLDEHAVALHRHVRALVGANDADDVTQEVLIAALRAYPGLRDGSNLKGWLWTIARHKAIDRFRHDGRRPSTVPLEDDPGGGDGVVPPGADDELWSAVRRLPDGQRAAVALRFVDDMPYREIAEVLGCTEGAARQRVHDGVKALRGEVTA